MTEWPLDETGRAALREAAVDLYRAQRRLYGPAKDAEALAASLPVGLPRELGRIHDRLWLEAIQPILAQLHTKIGVPSDDRGFLDGSAAPMGAGERLAEIHDFIGKADESLAELVGEAPDEHPLRDVAHSVGEIDQELGRIIEQHPEAFAAMDRAAAAPEPAPRPVSRPLRWNWPLRGRGRGGRRSPGGP